MPTKFKESTKVILDRNSGKSKMVHTYIRNVDTDELMDTLEKDSAKPKLKQKVRNELVKRGVI